MLEYPVVFALGGAAYGLLEILWRGWTHWTMLICGGVCFTLMYLIDTTPMDYVRKCILCAVAITTVEFLTGCIVNLKLGMNVWDYSTMPFDLLGQICPQFVLMWLCLSVPGLRLCRALRHFVTSFTKSAKRLGKESGDQ